MTVNTTTSRVSYAGNGSTTTFSVPFYFLAAADLVVIRTASNGAQTTLVLNTDYTVTGAGNPAGGSVVCTTAPALTTSLVIFRDPAATQLTDYQANDPFPAETHERALDKLTMLAQRLKDLIARSLTLSDGDTTTASTTLPSPSSDKLIGWNETATALQNVDPITIATQVTTGTARADLFSGDGVQTAFTLSENPAAQANLDVSVGGVTQRLGIDFLWSTGTTLTFTSAPPSGTNNILVRYWQGLPQNAAQAAPFTPDGALAVERTIQSKLRDTVSVKDFGAVGDGVTSDTSKIQACFDAAAANAAKEVLIDAGNYLLTNTRNDAQYTCAVVIKGLKNCVVRGAKGAKFTVNASGSPVVGFGFFRIEECENVTFTGFELDGSGVSVTTGANRLLGIAAANFDVNSPSTDLPTVNKQLEFSHLYIHDSGGGIQVIRRSTSLADTPMTEGLSVHDCRMENLLGVDHGVACPRTRSVHVFNNRFVNNIPTVTPQDNMAVDASSGAEVVHIHNNYVYGFVFGMKCESVTGVGPSGTEVRSSKRVTFENNRLEEIGDPTVLVWPGPSGGDTYGIKINGKDCVAIGNTVKARTIGVTTGGLEFGIAVVNTHNQESHDLIEGNIVTGSRYGVLHNDTTAANLACSVHIRDNRIQDNQLYGVAAQANCIVENNKIYRAGLSAVLIQSPILNTFIRNNFAYNCASSNNAVTGSKVVFYQQGTGSQGFFTFEGNVIVDDRGASAAQHGYFFHAGTVYTNAYIFTPGYTTGLLTGITFDKYFSVIGTSLAVDGTTAQGPRTIYTTNSPSVIAPWNVMTWRVGDRAVFVTPTVGSPKAWVCTVAGTPGTWVSEGNL